MMRFNCKSTFGHVASEEHYAAFGIADAVIPRMTN